MCLSKDLKSQLRHDLRKVRAALTDRPQRSLQVQEHLKKSQVWDSSKCVLIYVSYRSELETRVLMSEMFTEKRCVVPFCEPDGGLSLFEVRSWSELEPGAFGIPEPKAEIRKDPSRRCAPGEIDLALLPGVGFDGAGRRLGQGGGFYDRLLPEFSPKTVTVGLAFECQCVERVPAESYDRRVRAIVTEAGFRPARFVLGILGGIACGKSLLSRLLVEKHGACVFDADRAGHIALNSAEIQKKIVARWGEEVLNPKNQIDRKKVAEIVFQSGNESELQFLNEQTRPYISEKWIEFQTQCDTALAPFRVLDAALLLEAGWGPQCTELLYLDTPRERQLKFAQMRGWTLTELELRESRQFSLEKKRAAATIIIQNSGSELELEENLQRLI